MERGWPASDGPNGVPMIPTSSGNANVSLASGSPVFHVIIDDFHRSFSMDGPEGPSGVRLHYEMQLVARAQAKKLRDFDLRAASHEAALSEMKTRFPDYAFLGTWVEAQSAQVRGKKDAHQSTSPSC
jgi:hypothetical protein